MKNLEALEGFQWDKGNLVKNRELHNVTYLEIEQIFFNSPLVTGDDEKHSSPDEKRYYALGKTDEKRLLFVVFTIRKKLIRVITARDMSAKERRIYHEKEKENS